jgi:hypothetical protein
MSNACAAWKRLDSSEMKGKFGQTVVAQKPTDGDPWA